MSTDSLQGDTCRSARHALDWQSHTPRTPRTIDQWSPSKFEPDSSFGESSFELGHSAASILSFDAGRAEQSYRKRDLARSIEEEIESSRHIYRLESDWDGAGSPGYRRETWERAANFLRAEAKAFREELGRSMPAPVLGPGPEGNVDLYWKTKGFELLVTVPQANTEPLEFYGDDYGNQKIQGTLEPTAATAGLLYWLIKK